MQSGKAGIRGEAVLLQSGRPEMAVGVAPDSYTNERYRVEIHVLEGRPAKGYVVVSDRCPTPA